MKRLSQKLHEETECSLCIDKIRQPKILPCHHGFCCECLNNLADSRRQMNETTFACPECKASYPLPEDGRFDEFQSSFHHNRLLDLLALAEADEAAPSKCSSCEMRQMDYRCDECNVCVCAKCCLSGHKDHVLIELEDAARQNKERIAQLLTRVDAGVRACRQHIAWDKFNFKIVGEHKDAVKREIGSRVQEAISALRRREEELKRELDNLHEEQYQKHLTKQSDLEMDLAALQSYYDYGEMLLRKNATCELATLERCVFQSGEDLLVAMKTQQHCNYVTGEFVTSQMIDQTVLSGNLGRVIESDTDPSCSTAEGKGLHVAICGEKAEFKIVTKDSQKQTCYYDGDQISVEVTTTDGSETEVQIENCRDGTYRVTYVPRTHGRHLLTVKIKGRRLLGVPGCVHVTPHKYRVDGSFGSCGSGKGQFKLPSGIAVSSTGELAVADYGNGRVQLFTPDCQYLTEFGSGMYNPTSVAYTKTDNIIVIDSCEKGLPAALYTNRGEFIKEFGPSLLNSVRSVSVTQEGHVAVCEWENKSIKILSQDGEKLIRSFKSITTTTFPSNVVHYKNRYFVSYPVVGLVKVWNKQGKFLFDIGKPGVGIDAKLIGPLGLAIDTLGNLMVCESADNRLVVFSREGQRLSTVGESGTALKQFKRPTDVALGKDGKIHIVDQANNRIQIFK